ncbi:hypothetical protein KCU71_g22, partial [Aureobasidium melanogenum]
MLFFLSDLAGKIEFDSLIGLGRRISSHVILSTIQPRQHSSSKLLLRSSPFYTTTVSAVLKCVVLISDLLPPRIYARLVNQVIA